jgi:hypothetical protein
MVRAMGARATLASGSLGIAGRRGELLAQRPGGWHLLIPQLGKGQDARVKAAPARAAAAALSAAQEEPSSATAASGPGPASPPPPPPPPPPSSASSSFARPPSRSPLCFLRTCLRHGRSARHRGHPCLLCSSPQRTGKCPTELASRRARQQTRNVPRRSSPASIGHGGSREEGLLGVKALGLLHGSR